MLTFLPPIFHVENGACATQAEMDERTAPVRSASFIFEDVAVVAGVMDPHFTHSYTKHNPATRRSVWPSRPIMSTRA